MAEYNQQQSGYVGEEQRKPVSTYNAHQDEFGFKEGNDYPAGEGGYGDRQRVEERPQQPGMGQGQGYEDQAGETFQDATDRMTGDGDTGAGVGGSKSAYGAPQEGTGFDHPTSEQTQFGLAGKDDYGREGSDPQLGQTGASPHASSFDSIPTSSTDTVPAGEGWSAEDTSAVHGAKKDGLVNKIKEKLPGQHNSATGAGEDSTAPPKKGIMEKIKEKLPGHHGTTDSGM